METVSGVSTPTKPIFSPLFVVRIVEAGRMQVEIVVPENRHVVLRGVHHLDGAYAFAGADIRIPLAEIARVGQDHVGAQALEDGAQAGDTGVSVELAVNVVGVENDRFAGIVRVQVIPDIRVGQVLVRGPVLFPGRLGKGGGHAQEHHKGQDQCKQFFHDLTDIPFCTLIGKRPSEPAPAQASACIIPCFRGFHNIPYRQSGFV